MRHMQARTSVEALLVRIGRRVGTQQGEAWPVGCKAVARVALVLCLMNSLTLASLLFGGPATACAPPTWDTYDDGGGITSAITSPTDQYGYPCSCEVTCTASAASDQDHRYYASGSPQHTYPPDTFNNSDQAYTWSAKAGGEDVGSWKNGDNTGQTVTWIAPSTTQTDVTITLAVNDDAIKPPGETGERSDSDKEYYVHVKVFKIRCVEIKATYDVDIYWPNPADGLPSISDTIWKVNLNDFQNTGALNETCTRKAVADIFSPVTQHYKLALTLDRYPQCTTNVTPTTTLSGHGDPITETGWSPVFTIADHSSIYKHEWTMTLVFKVGGIQSDDSQGISSMADFMIYDDYLCPQSEFTRPRLSHVCYWAYGGTQVTKTDIPQKVQENCWYNFTWETWVDPWSLETQAGDCRPHSGLIQRALEVLGISADGVTSENDATTKVGETRWCDQHGYEWHYFVEAAGSHAETNFEAVCNVLLIDEESPYNCYYDKAMGSPYQAGTYAQMWTEWNDYPPPNYKVIHHYTTWENH